MLKLVHRQAGTRDWVNTANYRFRMQWLQAEPHWIKTRYGKNGLTSSALSIWATLTWTLCWPAANALVSLSRN